MKIIFLTLFPELILANTQYSILQKAIKKKMLTIETVNPREYAEDKHRLVDDTPFGGGSGMLLKPEPWIRAICLAKAANPSAKVIAMVPEGEILSTKLAIDMATAGQDLIFVCGHYEGFDARIYEFVDGFLSIGDYILTGGELAALVTLDALMRFIPGVLGKLDSAYQDSFANGLLEHPHYTRPVEFQGLIVPEVLRSGNHKQINVWRRKKSLEKTFLLRKDLLKKSELQRDDGVLLLEIIDEVIKKEND